MAGSFGESGGGGSQFGNAFNPSGGTDTYLAQLNTILAAGEVGGPWAAAIALVVFAVIDAIPGLESLFAGRPREEATTQVIKRLSRSPNASAQIYAAELHRLLTKDDIVISDSSASGQAALGTAFHQFVQGLVAQGVPLQRARNIGVASLSRAAQAGSPLPPELQHPLSSQLALNGPPAAQDVIALYTQRAADMNLTGDAATKYIAKQVADHLNFHDLTQLTIGQAPLAGPVSQPGGGPSLSIPAGQPIWPQIVPAPQLTTPGPQGGPPPIPPNPIIDPRCQSSYTYDPNTQTYTPTPYCAMVPAGYQYDPLHGVATPGNPPADEVQAATQDLAYAISAVAYHIKNPSDTGSNALDLPNAQAAQEACCSQIVSALNSIAAALAPQSAIPPAGGVGTPAGATSPAAPSPEPAPAIDLSTINSALTMIAKCVCETRGSSPADLDALLKRIADTLDQLAKSGAQVNSDNDVPQALIDQLVNTGIATAAMAQLAGGGPWQRLWAILQKSPDDGPWTSDLKALGIGFARTASILAGFGDPGLPAGWRAGPLEPAKLAADAQTVLAHLMTGAFDVAGGIFTPITSALLKVHGDTISRLRNVKPGQEQTAATTLLNEAIGAGVGAHFAAIAGEAWYPTKNLGLPQMAALMAELAGFREIMAGIIGPEVAQAITVPHTYLINSQARAVQPDLGNAGQMHARGLISASQFATLAGYAGLDQEWEPAVRESFYRGINPRQLLRALDLGVLSDAEIEDELSFSGLRPSSIDRMKRVAHALALLPYQTRALNTAIQAFERGVIQQPELDQFVADAQLPDGAERYVLLEAHYRKLIQLSDLYEKSVSEAYAYGRLSDADYLQQLESAGINPADANARYSLDSTKRHGKEDAATARAEAHLQAERTRREIAVAKASYNGGAIDQVSLAAQLVNAGEPASLVPADVALTALRADARLEHVYNLRLDKPAAALLKAKVAVTQEQTIKGLIHPATAKQELLSYGVSEPYAEALSAKWAAQKFGTALPP